MEHPAFDITNPQACEHLMFGFAASVPNFHAEDGSGYVFMADALLKVGSWWCVCVGGGAYHQHLRCHELLEAPARGVLKSCQSCVLRLCCGEHGLWSAACSMRVLQLS